MMKTATVNHRRTRSGDSQGIARIAALAAALSASPATAVAAADRAPGGPGFGEGEKLFALHVKPLLAEKCVACHSPEEGKKLKGELDLTSRDAMLRGGESSDTVLVPGDAAASLLFLATTWTDPDYEMPPKEADRLSEAQQGRLRDWIDAGAPWPDDARVAAIVEALGEGVRIPTSGGLDKAWTDRRYNAEDLWAYRPVAPPEVPADHTGNPVDWFIDRKLGELGLEPAPAADPVTLVRRIRYDLTGLPPTPGEVAAFVDAAGADGSRLAEAATALIDRLLATPQYGEQYGNHWLDVVRYADSAGFANDYERPNAWRYRDYVIRSFHEDKPYDRFVREQIAGDEIDPEDPEMLIAAGFLRMGPWEHTGMSVARITRQQFLDDVTDSVGQTFLAHAFQCARCHDHKFDPVPTRDYYRIQAVFATTQFADRKAPWLDGENRSGFAEEAAVLRRAIERYGRLGKEIDRKEKEAAEQWYAERGLPYTSRQEAMRNQLPEDQVVPLNHGLAAADLGIERIARKNGGRHSWELDRFEPIAFSVYSGKTRPAANVNSRIDLPEDPMGPGTLEKTAILAGGDPFSPTEPVTPGVLSAVPGGLDVAIPTTPAGRRRAFADWVTDPANPLTARVMVNRIWAWHFGQPIAGNPNNFGSTGKKPTHPDLLDWLAREFVRSGWSVKHLHRLIMASEAYRRGSRHPDPGALAANDPDREMHAIFRARRLTAEELRDSMLQVSGELETSVGGIPCRPDMNLEAALQPRMIMGTYAPSYQPNPRPEQRNRRSVYALRIRGLRDPFMETFNQPGPDKSCERRETSTVTPQVFTLFNSRESWDRALAFADRVRRETNGRHEAVDRAFELALSRKPIDAERRAALAHWEKSESLQPAHPPAAPDLPAEITREAKEEVTGETFSFRERLFFNEGYVPDLQPGDVDPATRALADLCLVLLNSNEFAYVY